jgi:undecaprenyl-diphosphatase
MLNIMDENLFNIVILALIQGITEFLPISSSGHLVILPKLMRFEDPGLALDAFLHLGTLLAAVIYFRTEIFNLCKSLWLNGNKEQRKLSFGIMVATIPAVLGGLLLKDTLLDSELLRSVKFVAMTLAGGALLMWLVDRKSQANAKSLLQITTLQIFLIGCAQALALFPGVSRSGATIVACLLCGLNRSDSARFAFLVGLPAIGGAGLLALKDLFSAGPEMIFQPQILAVGFLVSFLSGYVAIDFLIKFLKTQSLIVFVVYRILMAMVLLMLF